MKDNVKKCDYMSISVGHMPTLGRQMDGIGKTIAICMHSMLTTRDKNDWSQ